MARRNAPPVTVCRSRPMEPLEARRLLASTSTLIGTDFATNPWSAVPGAQTGGAAATLNYGAYGTIDVEDGTTPSNALSLGVTNAPSAPWTSDLTSGLLNVSTTETNLGKLTLGFSLSASQARPVKVIVTSYNAGGTRLGALAGTVVPAAANNFQHYAMDLSTMAVSGSGTFSPTAPKISFDFEMASSNGWSSAGTPTLRIDNVNYSKPAYYVSPIDGNNNDNGTTEALAFATIQKAIDVSQPGDMILLKGGDATHKYTVATNGRNLITKGGSPAAWVSIRNYPGQSPLIYTEGWAAIQIGAFSASTATAIGYVELRGLHVVGSSAKVGSRDAPDGAYNPDPAYASKYGPYGPLIQSVDPATGKTNSGSTDSRTNGNGLSVDGGNETNKPHDIRIADNLVEDCAGGGIGAGDADRIVIENNVVRDNCYWDKYATSGISILSAYQFDATSGDYSRLIRNNVSSGNIHKERWVRDKPFFLADGVTPNPSGTRYSDGNGIIIDYNHFGASGTVGDPDYVPARIVTARTLVSNNLVYDNGGSGIHSFNSDHIDIINNTAYLNSSSPYLQYGQIFSQSTDTRIYNNILVAPTGTGEAVNGGTRPTATNLIRYANNLYFGGNPTALNLGGNPAVKAAAWPNDTYNTANVNADPLFVNASVDPAVADFHLKALGASISPAIGLGTLSAGLSPYLDADGTPRYGNPDSGAFEFIPAAPAGIALTAASDTGASGDNKTRLKNGPTTKLSFDVSGTIAGATIELYAGTTLIGTATGTGTGPNAVTTVQTNGTAPLADGPQAITAVQTFGGAPSVASAALGITVDTLGATFNGATVDDGTAQRSRVRKVTLAFAEAVTLGATGLVVANSLGAAAAYTLTASADSKTYTLSFPGTSLADGVYTLTLPAATATDAAGNALLGGDRTVNFHCLYGDVDGDRGVSINDFNAFASAFGTTAGNPAYVDALDFDGDSGISINDFNALASRFGTTLPAAAPNAPRTARPTRRR